jgi:hypothetical protein
MTTGVMALHNRLVDDWAIRRSIVAYNEMLVE